MTFPFEQLKVYDKALLWVEASHTICASAKGKAISSLLDQLLRASSSIPLNIAEGNGRWHSADKQQFFRIARGSTFECVPILQILKMREAITEENYKSGYAILEEIGKMLSGLINAAEAPKNKICRATPSAKSP